jgi:enoyl-CoA hydratase
MGYIGYEPSGGVGVVTFTRLEAMNALTADAIEECLGFFEKIGQGLADEPQVHALVLTGAGRAFIAGADVKEMREMSPEQASRFCARGNQLMAAIERFPVPVIAAVNGFALGGGLEVALAADFLYTAADAKLGFPEVGLGIIPGFGGVRRLSQRIGPARAKELLYTGRLVSGQEAQELGIANRAVPAEELLGLVRQTAALIGKAGRAALAAAKRHANECALLDAEAAAIIETDRFAALFAGPEPREGMTALLEKRSPAWVGKER